MEWTETEVYVFLALSGVFLLRLYLYLRGHISPLPLAGRHVLVTGGSSGLGLELAKECYARGASVTIVARNTDRLALAKAEIESVPSPVAGSRVQSLPCNLSKEDQVAPMVIDSEKTFGPVFLVAACAGSVAPGFLDADMRDYRAAMEDNFLTALYTAHAVTRRMKAHGGGILCFVSDEAVFKKTPGLAPMTPSKAAIKSLADSLRLELHRSSIAVHVFYPPPMDTPGYRKSQSRRSPLTEQYQGRLGTARGAALILLSGVSAGDSDITASDTGSLFRITSQGGGRKSILLLDIALAPISVLWGHVRARVMRHIVRKRSPA